MSDKYAGILERLGAAAEGSRELDLAVYAASHGGEPLSTAHEWLWRWRDNGEEKIINVRNLPHYTTSLDAALTLVPEGLLVRMSLNYKPGPALVYIEEHKDGGITELGVACKPTLPLALFIAALRARQAIEDRGE